MEGLVCKSKGFIPKTFQIPKESLLMHKKGNICSMDMTKQVA